MQEKGETRVWVDGCYDITHFGHANMLRQAKNLGTKLVVGVHSDEDIRRVKRPPVYSQSERVKMVKAMKWTDEVIEAAPYNTTTKTLDENNCDFAVHGDDKTTDNAGISTTALIKRILRHTAGASVTVNDSESVISQYTGSSFLLTTRKIYEFTKEDCCNYPKPGDKIIYVAGSFEIFHVGHLDFLEKAKSLGDYLIVGLHADDPLSSNRAILSLNERVMNLLSYKCVNEVLIDAPRKITTDLMDHFNVNMVYHGRFSSANSAPDLYEIPKRMKKFEIIDSGSDVTTEKIIERIRLHDEQYRTTNKLKEENELINQ